MNHGSQHEGIVIGEILEDLPGRMGVACMKRGVGDMGGPVGSDTAGRIRCCVGKPEQS
ncbi:MAG TPA: hypothetical protein VMX95_06890 [Thermodesulfobacteriota bacterium]|nr:hypothetical protein [Thermodesulfobacteriota bacterium]